MKVERISLIVPSEPDYVVFPIMNELKRYRKIAKDKFFAPIFEEHGINKFKSRNKTFKTSIGVLSIASVLESLGVKVNVLHQDYLTHIGEWDNSLKKAAVNSDMIGFTALTVTYNNALNALKFVKSIRPEITTIIGGPHATYLPSSTLKDGFDIVVRGEGEETICELVTHLRNNVGLEAVRGISYLHNNLEVTVPLRHRIKGVDIPLPAYHLIPEEMGKNISLQVTSSRGCPFSCKYCVENGNVSYRDIDAVLQDVALVTKHACLGNTIWMSDSLMGVDYERTKKLSSALHTAYPELVFFFQTRPSIMSEDLYWHLASNNFLGIKFGIESFSNKTLDIMNKKQSYESYLSELRLVKKIFPVREANFIVGYPGESLEDCHESLERLDIVLGEDLIQTISCSVFTPYPGTEMFHEPEKKGLKINSMNFDNFITKGFPPNFNTLELSEFEIYSLLIRFIALETSHLYRRVGISTYSGFDHERISKYAGKRS